MKLSIAMMVKNESRYIGQCLEALKPILNQIQAEIVIVDTGSQDNTVEIAKKYTDKVYFHEWENDYSKMRNISISYTQGEWILIIDADEIIEDCSELIAFFKNGICENYYAGTLLIKSYAEENNTSKYGIMALPRLCRRYDGIGFKGAIHEQFIHREPTYNLKTVLLHYGYMKGGDDFLLKKNKFYISLLLEEIEKDPKNYYYYYQLAKSYSVNKEYNKALVCAEKAYYIAKEANMLKTAPYIWIRLANMYIRKNWFGETEKICKEGLEHSDDSIDLYYLLAKSQASQYKDEEALSTYNKYLKLSANMGEAIKQGVFKVSAQTLNEKDKVYVDIATIYIRKKDYTSALDYTQRVEDSNLKDVFPAIIEIYLRQKKYGELKEYFTNKVLSQNDKALYADFIDVLERKISNYADSNIKKEIAGLFIDFEDDYSTLSKVRLLLLGIEERRLNDKDISMSIKKLNFNELPLYYNDIFLYMLKEEDLFIEIASNVEQNKVEAFLEALMQYSDEFVECALDYLKNQRLKLDFNSVRINKILLKLLISSDRLSDEDIKSMFAFYIINGKEYVRGVYKRELVDQCAIQYISNVEDKFFFLIMQAEKNKDDVNLYVKSLNKALDIWPCASKGIKLLVEVLYETVPTEEMQEYLSQIKKDLRILIESGNIAEALTVINEIEGLCHKDIEIISMKAVIAIIENRLSDAEEVLEKGLMCDSDSSDILYNIAYLKELQGDMEQAKVFYEKALETCGDCEMKVVIVDKLKKFN